MTEKWYALQETTEDDWGTGASTFEDAIAMANDREWANIIAVIENDVCIEELYKGIDF